MTTGGALEACPGSSLLDAFACGRASQSQLRRIETHVARCSACAAAIADALRTEAEAEEPPRRRLGRYVLLDVLGRGASATVYAAYDPRLRRHVALKVLGHGSEIDGMRRERTLREAQALARVEHPNVLTVFDVSSIDHDPMFIAMELVAGSNLRAWASRATSWREIVRVLVDAAHGLAALHDAGIVHRDVKPDNILVGDDGRVMVADLGLASALHGDTSQADREAEHDESLDITLTRTGMVLGTPRYMSPEHFAGEELDARSDQFSLCVTGAEVLFGRSGFVGSTIDEFRRAVRRGPNPQPPSDRAPAALWRVLRRGLAPDPRARHDSVRALASALLRVVDRGRRAMIYIGGGGIVASLAIAGAAIAPPPPRCGDTLALADHWDPTHNQALEEAFVATAARHGADAAQRVTEHLQQWSDRWNGAYLARCTGLPTELASSDRDAPLRCLARQRVEFVADVAALSSIQGASTSGDRILSLVRGLPNPGECQRAADDVPLLDPTEVEREVERAAADVRAAHRLARHAEAHLGVSELMRAVDQVRPSLRADLLLAAAEVLHADDADAALRATDAALRAAVAAASPALIARALSARAAELANLGRLEPAVAASELALLTFGELGLGGVEEVEVRRAHAVALGRLGRIDDALAVLAPLDGALEPGSLPWARYQRTLAPLLGQRGEVERALSSFEGARDAFAALHGPHADETVQLGLALVTFASEHRAPQRAAAAMPRACIEPQMRASLERATAADCLVARALVDLAAGATDAAYAGATEAVALHEMVFGSDAPSTLGTLGLVASIAAELGKLGEAEAIHRNLADTFARTRDREAEALASGNLGATLGQMGRPREAIEAYLRSLAATATSRLRARALSGLAACRLELGEPDVARRELERALIECEQGGVPTPIELDVRWGLARLVVDDTPARARDLAARARALAELLEDTATRDEIDAWLAASKSTRVEL